MATHPRCSTPQFPMRRRARIPTRHGAQRLALCMLCLLLYATPCLAQYGAAGRAAAAHSAQQDAMRRQREAARARSEQWSTPPSAASQSSHGHSTGSTYSAPPPLTSPYHVAQTIASGTYEPGVPSPGRLHVHLDIAASDQKLLGDTASCLGERLSRALRARIELTRNASEADLRLQVRIAGPPQYAGWVGDSLVDRPGRSPYPDNTMITRPHTPAGLEQWCQDVVDHAAAHFQAQQKAGTKAPPARPASPERPRIAFFLDLHDDQRTAAVAQCMIAELARRGIGYVEASGLDDADIGFGLSHQVEVDMDRNPIAESGQPFTFVPGSWMPPARDMAMGPLGAPGLEEICIASVDLLGRYIHQRETTMIALTRNR